MQVRSVFVSKKYQYTSIVIVKNELIFVYQI
jgi:hypothetical protein